MSRNSSIYKMNNKYLKDYDMNKESSYIKYWHVNNLYGWAMSQKLPVNNFKWIEDTSQFNEDFRFLEADVQYPKNYMNFMMIYHVYQKE